MRYIIISILLSFGHAESVFADVGNCIKFNVDIQLTDGQRIMGFVYAGGYEKRFEFKDISFLDFLKTNNPSDTLHVYTDIRQLKFPTAKEGTENCQFHFDATTSENDLKISKKTIKTIKVISYTVCNNCDNPDEKEGYNWNGIYPAIITELTKTEIDLLQTMPKATVNFGHDIENNTDGYWMISYSSEHSLIELEKIKNEFLLEADRLLKENKWDIVQVNYKTLKNRLRTKKVILFKIGYAL